MCKLFVVLCLMFGVKHLTTTASNHKTNEQVEQYNRTIFMQLWHYVAENKKD